MASTSPSRGREGHTRAVKQERVKSTFCGSTLTLLITHKEQGELESFLCPPSKERLLSG